MLSKEEGFIYSIYGLLFIILLLHCTLGTLWKTLSKWRVLKYTCQSAGVATLVLSVNCRESTTRNISLKEKSSSYTKYNYYSLQTEHINY